MKQGPGLTCGSFGTRNGANASIVTTHGDIVVPKFLAKKGPSGMYSHFWISRAVDNIKRKTTYQNNSLQNSKAADLSVFRKYTL